jgi:RNA-binding protein
MALTATQRRYLKSLAHPLKPVVMVGAKGLTDAVIRELQVAFDSHELLKLRLSGVEREAKAALAAQLTDATGAELVQSIGHVLTLYRQHPESPQIALPGKGKLAAKLPPLPTGPKDFEPKRKAVNRSQR